MFFKIKSEMIFLKNLTAVLTRVKNLTTMLVTTVLHRTVIVSFISHGKSEANLLVNGRV